MPKILPGKRKKSGYGKKPASMPKPKRDTNTSKPKVQPKRKSRSK